ncbi:phosphate ABC transporter permease PstA [Kurthia massiliensis]|uniref:phosphate ABC transporter permease PstA n=1 Tax=Kurthia massiliensis TaxID=1033739 RepID=UPI00028A28B5|nr:phosphate ABC transporter permease PstA [Kurthia massiliensis]
MTYIHEKAIALQTKKRRFRNTFFQVLFTSATILSLIILVVLLYRMVTQGSGYLSLDFLQQFSSRFPEKAGVYAGLIGSIAMLAIVAPVAVSFGVGAAIYLEEYAKKNRVTSFIQMNISNLAGVPSIVFGLLGLTIFVRMLGMGKSVLAAALTMSLLILPVIIVAAQEAIRSVPTSLREASYGMGATKWQTIYKVVLPAALPGILTGSILGLSRAIGETAPLVVIGIPVIIQFLPDGIFSEFTALPMLIFDWAKRPQEEFQYVAAAGILVLMTLLILMNSIAVWIRHKFQHRY